MKRCCDSDVRARNGYSLLELLIVLGILSAMAAIAVPSLQGPLDKSRLRSAGGQVRTSLAKARSIAIREGAVVEFRYRIGGREWQLRQRMPATISDAGRAVSNQLQSNQPAFATGPAEFDNGVIGDRAADPQIDATPFRIVRTGLLPDGVQFSANPVGDSSTENDGATFSDATSFGGSDTPAWSDPISFFPNGASRDASLIVTGSRDFVVHVSVRGLTSAVSCSAPVRRTAHSSSGENPIAERQPTEGAVP
ncbi:MAG: prepilin-type N-terminal cleavage/methylation domain-containing protein [Planctomycetaceae bacterium]